MGQPGQPFYWFLSLSVSLCAFICLGILYQTSVYFCLNKPDIEYLRKRFVDRDPSVSKPTYRDHYPAHKKYLIKSHKVDALFRFLNLLNIFAATFVCVYLVIGLWAWTAADMDNYKDWDLALFGDDCMEYSRIAWWFLKSLIGCLFTARLYKAFERSSFALSDSTFILIGCLLLAQFATTVFYWDYDFENFGGLLASLLVLLVFDFIFSTTLSLLFVKQLWQLMSLVRETNSGFSASSKGASHANNNGPNQNGPVSPISSKKTLKLINTLTKYLLLAFLTMLSSFIVSVIYVFVVAWSWNKAPGDWYFFFSWFLFIGLNTAISCLCIFLNIGVSDPYYKKICTVFHSRCQKGIVSHLMGGSFCESIKECLCSSSMELETQTSQSHANAASDSDVGGGSGGSEAGNTPSRKGNVLLRLLKKNYDEDYSHVNSGASSDESEYDSANSGGGVSGERAETTEVELR